MTATSLPAVPDRPAEPDRSPVVRAVSTSRLTAWWPLLVLAVAAFAIRWPNLWYIPQFTDEVFDAQVSYDILQGKRPLIGVNAYTGAFHYYVQAGLLWLFGPSIYLPRLFIMVLGVGAVLATALLGAEVARRAAPAGDARAAQRASRIGALVGGGLLATSPVHVLTNSHLAWPHSTVLFYLALAFWLLERSVRLATSPPDDPMASSRLSRRGGWELVGAGLMFGLAQQQHPTILLFWPVFLGYVVWRGRSFFRSRWAYAAVAAFLIGISPLIVYNLTSDLGTLKESADQTAGYQQGRETKDFSYKGRAIEILLTAARIPAGAIDRRSRAIEYLLDPMVIGYSALCIAGLVAAWRLGARSLPLAVVAFLVLLPMFPASHDDLPRQGRYLMPLLPLAFAGIGGLVALAMRRLRGASLVRRLAFGPVLAAMVLLPLVPLARYELQVLAANETNDRYFVTLGALERQRRPDEAVVLDPTLKGDRTGAAGTAQRTFDFMVEFRDIPRVMLDQSTDRIARRIDGPTALVLADQRPSSLSSSNNADAWTLEPLDNDPGGGFTIWRITRR